MSTAPAQTATIRAVHCVHGRHRSYLEIVPERDRVRVQRTELGKRALNRFWIMWLRKLLLEQAPAHRGYGVEVRNNCVVVSSEATMDALMGTVHQIAAEIRPLHEPPMIFEYDFGKRERRYGLKFGSRTIDWEGIVDSIVMPRGVRLELSLWPAAMNFPAEGRICLVRPIDHQLSLSQLSMLLEMEIALACHQ
ncbi:MAG TPA: hypothetical protein PLN95_03465 [Candidatus Saccharibacteria bacterium]|nr:hypothetical protein [Candidatus Saccharibacteria bacterium]